MSEAEIINAIKKLKNSKSPGEDGITKEMINYGGDLSWKATTILIRQIFNGLKIPEEWKIIITVPI